MKSVGKGLSALLACLALTSSVGVVSHAAFDEHLDNYQLDNKVVKADRTKDQFGNTITEESYYRTGGDVKVITREEIEKRHYNDLTEAIKRIPGITFHNPGYRGGEYGYQFFNNGISINGDSRVIVLVDGRRVDNSTSTRISGDSTRGSKSTGVNLDQVTNINAVDKIEVIKGPGASAYGSDATGGVINIITRKGGTENEGTLDVSTGSWHHHNYNFTYSGSAGEDKSLHYFVGLTQSMSGDTKYRDGHTGETGTLGGSRWHEKGANIRLDKDFSDKERLTITYNHKSGRDGYPISTPNLQYWNQKDWNRIIFDAAVGKLGPDGKLMKNAAGQYYTTTGNVRNPGYHNLFALDGLAYNSFSKFQNNDVDIKYTFDRQADMESFVRLYNQRHKYSSSDKYAWRLPGVTVAGIRAQFLSDFPNGVGSEAELNEWMSKNLAPFPGGSKQALEEWVAKTGGKANEPSSYQSERNRGIQLQVARSLGKHDMIANVTYDKAANYSVRNRNGVHSESNVKRNSLYGYVQDKIHVTDNFDFTPSLRFTRYSNYTSSQGTFLGGKTNVVTPSINMQYRFGDKSSMYFGWTNLLRPLRTEDYTIASGIYKTPLENEKGNAYTIGYMKPINDGKTVFGINYSLTKMSNAIATFPIYTGDSFESTAVNAKENKKAFNMTVDHKINDHWSVGLAYTHLKDEWKVKDGYVVDPSWGYDNSGDINTGINRLRPANHYTANISYDQDKWSSGLLINYYTGASESAFTSNRFLIIDWNVNYDVTKDLTTYVAVTNLLNKAYETSSNAYYGPGSAAMPARSFMTGVKYKF